MDRAGAQELLMPFVQPKDLWEESGRWEVYGKELMRMKDRHDTAPYTAKLKELTDVLEACFKHDTPQP